MHALLPRTHPRTSRGIAQTFRDAGIVGAGGAGFPTYVKYEEPTPILLVNGAESEPGYYTDKLLFHERAEDLSTFLSFLKDVEGYERILVAVEESARPFMGPLERLAEGSGHFEVAYIENVYRYGQERALIKRILGREVPRTSIPPDVGVTVNNNETLFNMYRAVFEARPVTTKFVSVYGETPRHLAIEAPIGAYATDLLSLAGLDRFDPDHLLYDGGPILCDEVQDWTRRPYGIQRTTNGLLLVHPERKKTRARAYPRPDGPAPPTRLWNVEAMVSRVLVPLGGAFGEPAIPIVRPGDAVRAGELIAEAVVDALSVPAHASIDGFVDRVTDTHVAIVRGRRAPA